MAVRLLANVGVGQASLARHMSGVRHRQGGKDSGNRENETHFVGREGWSLGRSIRIVCDSVKV